MRQDELSVKQLKFIELKTTTELPLKDIYEQCGIKDINSYRRWLKNPKFVEELQKQSKAQLQRAVPEAINTLIRLLKSKKESVALKAATEILDRSDVAADITKAMSIKITLGDDTE